MRYTTYIIELDNNRKSVFFIQDIFPTTDEYIKREYTVNGNYLMLTSKHTAREIEKKVWRVIRAAETGRKIYAYSARYKRDIENAERQ